MHRQRQTERQTDERTEKDIQANRQTETDCQTDRRKEKDMGRQTHREYRRKSVTDKNTQNIP